MIDFEARQVIEALRSGVSSRTTSRYFSSARPSLIEGAARDLEAIASGEGVTGMIVSGKYGEGKTHFINTVFHMARQKNMVVSQISLSKETPFDKQFLIYQKLMSNTYLPGHLQPGFEQVFKNMTLGSPLAANLLEFAQNGLETNKLYFLLKSYLGTEDDDEKYMLLSDLEGDFINSSTLRQIYKRIFSQPAVYTTGFNKTKHCMDYFSFMSRLFQQMGYSGWVLLFDEAELIGRLGKKARVNAYRNMAHFLLPEEDTRLKAAYSVFALTASFVEDVIESKHEYENIDTANVSSLYRERAKQILDLISSTPQLAPLTQEEILLILKKVQELHGRAYSWTPAVDIQELYQATNKKGHLLRTRIRAAVEYLDQIYQYGQAADIQVNELSGETYTEDLPSLEELL